MEVKDLIGLHKLSGVDMSNENIKQDYGDYFENCQVINFILDKVTYTAIEDPSDGYRSHLRELKVTKNKINNKFKPQLVFGAMRQSDYGNIHDIVDFYDCKTSKIVLSVGTSSTDDYYPSFVANFYPENLGINNEN